MQWDAAIVRYALRNGGDSDLTLPNDDLRLLLAEQFASILMANDNLGLLQREKNFFNIRPISRLVRVPLRNALPRFGRTYGPTVASRDMSV
jgi:hypothetical protein